MDMTTAPGQSTWSDLLNSPLGADAATKGMAALQSGAVDPEDAADKIHPVLKAAGFGVSKKNILLKLKKAAQSAGPTMDNARAMPPQGTPSTPMAAQAAMAANPSGATMPGEMPDVNSVYADTPQAGVAPEPRASGLSREQQFSQQMMEGVKNDIKKSGTYLLSMDPEQLNDIYSRTSQLPTFQNQAKDIQNQREMMQIAASAPTDVFSKPLAGLLQSEFGRNVSAEDAAAGESPEQQRTGLLNMSEKLTGDQKDLSKSIFDAISKQKAGSYTDSLNSLTSLSDMAKAMNQANAVDPNKFIHDPHGPNPLQMKMRVFDQFQKYGGKDREALQGAQQAVDLLNSGGKITDSAVVTALARASGEVGRLSDYDQQLYSGGKDIATRVKRAITAADSGRLDDADRADLMALAKTYVNYRKDLLGKSVSYFSDNYAPALNLDSTATKKMLMPEGGWGLPDSKVNPAANQKARTKGATAPPATPGGNAGTVKVMSPAGVAGTIPASRLKDYLANGFKQVQ